MILNKYLCSSISADAKNEGLYIYGAGVYGKMIGNTHLKKYITAYIDKNASTINEVRNSYGDVFKVHYLEDLITPPR